MLKKYGKFYARWTDAQGQRHIKACKTAKAAKKAQAQMVHERKTKKALASRLRGNSSRPGRKATRKAIPAAKRASASRKKSATSSRTS